MTQHIGIGNNKCRRLQDYIFLLTVILIHVLASMGKGSNLDQDHQPIILKYFIVEYNESIKSEKLIESINGCFKFKVQFDAYDRQFNLQLSCNKKLLTTGSRLNIVGKNGLHYSLLKSSSVWIYTGYMQGDSNSYVHGDLKNNSFEGVLFTANSTYTIEQSYEKSYEFTSIIYKSSKMKPSLNSTNNLPDFKVHQKLGKLQAEHNLIEQQRKLGKSTRERVPSPNTTNTMKKTHWKRSFPDSKTCSLHLVADHTFVAAFNGNVKSALTEMIYHAVLADTIFRSTDFNGDGIGDNIGFSIADVTIFEESSPGYHLDDEYVTADDYLTAFASYDFSSYCLGFGFTFRDFDDGVLGLAWLGFSGEFSPPGGICESRVVFEDMSILSLNSGIITLKNYGQKQPREVTTLTMLHELAHSFGSPHDPSTELCSPGGKLGNFIMSSLAPDGNEARNNQFSFCSKEAIAPVILTKGHCLTASDRGWCGNGLVEDEEECDCGGHLQCNKIDTCCTPPGGLGNDAECTIRRDLGYVCSECPSTAMLANGSSCDQGTKRCSNGQCVVSVCMDLGLQECNCETRKEDMCHICCEDPTGCLPASTLGLFQQNGDIMLKPAGRVCNNYEGYCDTSGVCIMVDSESALNRLKQLFTNQGALSVLQWCVVNWYYGFILILSLCILVLLIRILACHPRRPIRIQNIKRPLKKTNSKHTTTPSKCDPEFQPTLLLEVFPSLKEVDLMEIVNSRKCLCDSIKELIKLKHPLNQLDRSQPDDLQAVLEEESKSCKDEKKN
ncbi:disintegrin and metalloproteinase domain-containing protein 10-like isoform X2 [Anneissia japonica]|uniref:disintegrin and metalloproteinase domain-containing protein 10-like isoform X2 n=1 Tax=Anneissia japonica TaxID=1529436 RepID=UPI0014258A17|nr:disintegrin and metalloproteinase domain-containing protein 10-like isoform X2 [Anneissia japonica]